MLLAVYGWVHLMILGAKKLLFDATDINLIFICFKTALLGRRNGCGCIILFADTLICFCLLP
jgi:hypothetical protein